MVSLKNVRRFKHAWLSKVGQIRGREGYQGGRVNYVKRVAVRLSKLTKICYSREIRRINDPVEI